MSLYGLSARGRAMSHASIRKRLLRSNSEDQKQMARNTTSQSFRPKLQRLLQQNKIEHIMNTDPHSKANLFYTTQINQMQKELTSTKKSLSTMVLKTKSKQYNINKLKNQLTRIQRDQKILREEGDINKNKIGDIQEKYGRKKGGLQEKVWVQKSYLHMKARLSKDQQMLKARHLKKDQAHQQLKNQLKILENNLTQLNQMHEKLQYSLYEAKQISKDQANEKSQFINLLNQQMAQKDMINDLKIQKINREDQIKGLMPSYIQKEQLQKYMHILFTHKLLSQIIKKKSQKLIDKYKNVQNAYLHIKSNTNIVELSKILARMETQDQQYESLLKKVDKLQKQLVNYQAHMADSTKRQHQILSKDSNPTSTPTLQIKYQGVQKDAYDVLMKQKQKLSDRKLQDDILKKKIMMWVQDHAAMFQIDAKVKNQDDFMVQLKMLQVSVKRKLGK